MEDELDIKYKKMCIDELQGLYQKSDENLVKRVHDVRNRVLDSIASADKGHANDDGDMEKMVVVFNMIEDCAEEFSYMGKNPNHDGFVAEISPLIEKLQHKLGMR